VLTGVVDGHRKVVDLSAAVRDQLQMVIFVERDDGGKHAGTGIGWALFTVAMAALVVGAFYLVFGQI
jgi:hypothetical protein